MAAEASLMGRTVHNTSSQATLLIILSTVMTGFSLLLIIIRFIIRFILIRDPGMDDYMIICAIIFTMGYLATEFIAQANGMGMPMTSLTLEDMTDLLKGVYAIEILYYACVTSIKSSIVFMYNRFAISMGFMRLCVATNVLLWVWFVICVASTASQCIPVHKAWDATGMVEGVCFNSTAFFYFTSSFNIVTDIWILVLPIRTLKKLQISQNQRYVLFGVFGVAGVATAMSCVRLYSIKAYTQSKDPFHDAPLVNIWSMVEINIGIICACAPALKPLFSPLRLLGISKPASYSYSSEPSGFSKKGTENSASQTQIVPESTYAGRSSGRPSPTPEEFELDHARPGNAV
ncbi:hypothetical protein F4809DRAFT_649397 [Biscogniauxia mediterranea]|nr:hypothetical protein F4809DRAFT_649397 [Biscogniauxia mediterranea]